MARLGSDHVAGWNADTAAGPLGAGTVTLVEGTSFCISLPNGDIHPDQPHGMFFQDTRILSDWVLSVNGQSVEPLTAQTKEPYRAVFAGRITKSEGYADTPLIVERRREVGIGMVEHVTVRNYSMEPVECTVTIDAGSDFADVFEVKEARVQRQWEESREVNQNALTVRARWQDIRKSVVVTSDVAEATARGFACRTTIPARGHWNVTLTVAPGSEGAAPAAPAVRPAVGELSRSDRRRQEWVAKIPVLHMGNQSIEKTLRRSYDDLGALRIEDPATPKELWWRPARPGL